MSLSVNNPELLAFIVDRIDVGIFVVDRKFKVQLWNRFMALHSGHSASDVVGQNLFDCFPELPRRWLRRKIESVIELENFAFTQWKQRPYLFRFDHNRPVTGQIDAMRQDCTFMPVRNAAGEIEAVCVALFDATDVCVYESQLREANARLEEMSYRDALTGLYNRRHLEECLETEFERVRRYGGSLGIILFDLDHFKQVNDTYGHAVGDTVLREVGRRINATVRATDIASRYGGEEFMIVLPSSGAKAAWSLAERLRLNVLAKPVEYEGGFVDVAISVGVSEVHEGTDGVATLLREADAALYESKRAGRNRVTVFSPGEAVT